MIEKLTCPAAGDLHGVGEGGGGRDASPEAPPQETEPRPLHTAGRSGTAPPGGRPCWMIQTLMTSAHM